MKGKTRRDPDPEAATWEESDEIVELEVKRPLDKVIPVRLSADKWEALRSQARELGIGPSTLARMWILAKLQGTPRLLSEEEARELMVSVLEQARKVPPASERRKAPKVGGRRIRAT